MATGTMISEPRTRRRFLGLASKAGMVIVGAGAALAATEQSAWAGNAACCNLAYPPGSSHYCKVNSSGSYICPSPGHWRTWCCCVGCGTSFKRTYSCAECTTGSTCYQGTFICSAYWTVNANGCTSGCPCGSAPKADPADLARWKAHPWGGPLTAAEKRAAVQPTPMHTNPDTVMPTCGE
jgi:hypothetical protein